MRTTRGFKIRRFFTVFKWVLCPKRKQAGYKRLDPPSCKSKTISKICNWGRSLKRGAKGLCCSKPGSGYNRLGQEVFDKKPVTVPKGHLAVYVGEKDDDPHRFLVPIIYFNHPLFAQLLREAEQEYGFEHPGGITIPCQISEFESVKTRIAAGESCQKPVWKRRIL